MHVTFSHLQSLIKKSSYHSLDNKFPQRAAFTVRQVSCYGSASTYMSSTYNYMGFSTEAVFPLSSTVQFAPMHSVGAFVPCYQTYSVFPPSESAVPMDVVQDDDTWHSTPSDPIRELLPVMTFGRSSAFRRFFRRHPFTRSRIFHFRDQDGEATATTVPEPTFVAIELLMKSKLSWPRVCQDRKSVV